MSDFFGLDGDFDLDATSPEDVVKSLGIDELSLEELLQHLKAGQEQSEFGFVTFDTDNDGVRKYHHIGKHYAPLAYEIFMRLMKKNEQPRLETFLAANRQQSTGVGPDTIIFWAHPDVIVGLYKALE